MFSRTNNCGELNKTHIGSSVLLCGWVNSLRTHGKIIFIDIRDRYGKTQVILDKDNLIDKGNSLSNEDVISISGKVSARTKEFVNKEIATGEIEVIVDKLEILSVSDPLPVPIHDRDASTEEQRLKYRYLELRNKTLQDNLIKRHHAAQVVRNFLSKKDFIEIETPVLMKSTPEGARDYLVPSRVHHGKFYALPQSPQMYKQLFMISGLDKYFQIVKCFRDEDLRADRQPEFTQIDCEMSFVSRDDIFNSFGGLIKKLFKNILNVDLGEIPIMDYDEAINFYGSDKPDLRFNMKFNDISDQVQGKGFKVFDDSDVILSITAKGCCSYSRKEIDNLTEFVKKPQIGSKGLVYVKCNSDGSYKSSVDKFYSQEDLKVVAKESNAVKGDLILILAGETKQTYNALSELRLLMGDKLDIRDVNKYKPVWIVNFPLFSWDDESKRFHSIHHPFTSPLSSDINLLEKEPEKVKANAYDLVINGIEIGGGSIRIHDKGLQKKVFEILGFTKEEANNQFGFLLNAFKYGTPPHGGIAFGFDRLCALFAGKESIRDFIAFPKNTSGKDVMIDSPSEIDKNQLKELGL